MHIVQTIILSRGELSTSKSVILKTRFAVLEEYHMMYSKKQCTNLKDIFYTLPYTMCFSFKQYQILWKGHCMRKRIHVWHRSRHVLLKWNALPFEKKCACWRNTHFKEMQSSFQGNHLKCLNMCWLKGLAQQCQYQIQSDKLIGCLCFGMVFLAYFDINQRQTCLIQAVHVSTFFFLRFSNETTDPNKFCKP